MRAILIYWNITKGTKAVTRGMELLTSGSIRPDNRC